MTSNSKTSPWLLRDYGILIKIEYITTPRDLIFWLHSDIMMTLITTYDHESFFTVYKPLGCIGWKIPEKCNYSFIFYSLWHLPVITAVFPINHPDCGGPSSSHHSETLKISDSVFLNFLKKYTSHKTPVVRCLLTWNCQQCVSMWLKMWLDKISRYLHTVLFRSGLTPRSQLLPLQPI